APRSGPPGGFRAPRHDTDAQRDRLHTRHVRGAWPIADASVAAGLPHRPPLLSTWTHIFAYFYSAIPSNTNGRPLCKTCENLCPGTYHWFTEGFDTKDLQEARTLLQELS